MAIENDKILYGGDVMLFIASGETKIPLAFSTSASLNMSMDTREVTSKDHGNYKSFKAGRFGWDASCDGLASFDLTGDTNGIEKVYALYKEGEAINFAFASKTGTSPDYTVDATKSNFTGEVLITSMSLSAADGDNVTYSVSMQGVGDLVLA